MRQMFSSQSIHTKLLMLSCLPLIIIIIFCVHYILKLFATSQVAGESLELVKIGRKLDNVIHNHAVERGLTQGYINSQGKGRDKLIAKRQVADEAEKAFRDLLSENHHKAIYQQLDHDQILGLLDKKASIRRAVDKLDQEADPFSYYSELNHAALTELTTISLSINIEYLRHYMTKAILLLKLKERAGQR